MSTSQQRRLLAVLAHPDDESFGPGGTLALYGHQGSEVHLVCATAGEAGAVPEEMLADDLTVADLRMSELRCAASHLKLAGVHLLGYRDSGMAGSADNKHPRALAMAPLEEVAAKVTDHIRRLKPQVIITFDPVGGYCHPDHIAIHNATVQAFHAAGENSRFPGQHPVHQPSKLYYHTFSRRFLRLAVLLLPLFGTNPRKFGKNGDIDLMETVSHDFPIHARIDFSPVADHKALAAACHASQTTGPTSGIMRMFFRLAGRRETFMRAFPEAPARLRETDLFSGLDLGT